MSRSISDYALVKAYLANPNGPTKHLLVDVIYDYVNRWPEDTQQDVLLKIMIPTRPEYLRRWAEQVEQECPDPETRAEASLGPWLKVIVKNKTIDEGKRASNKIAHLSDALHASKKEGGRSPEDSLPANIPDVVTNVGLKGFTVFLRTLRRKNPSERQVAEIRKVRVWLLCVREWDMETVHIVDHEPRHFSDLKGIKNSRLSASTLKNLDEYFRYQRFEIFRARYAEKYKLHNTVMNVEQVNPGAVSVVVAKYLRLYAQDAATEALAAK